MVAELMRPPTFCAASNSSLVSRVPHELDRAHEAEAADVPDVGMVSERVLEVDEEPLALVLGHLRIALALDEAEHRDPDGAPDGMGAVGVGVHPGGVRRVHDVRDLVADADAAEREVTRGDRLGELDHVRLHPPVLEAEHPSGAPEPRDHLVGDEEDVVLVADLADAREVVVLRDDHAARPLHGFGDEHGHRVGAFAENRLLELVRGRDSLAHPLRCPVAVGVGRGDVHEARHPGLEHRPVCGDSGCGHRGQGDPVVAPLARDDLGLVRLAPKLPVVAGHLEVAVARFAAAGGEIEAVDVRIGDGGEALGELDRTRVGAPRIPGCIGKLRHLRGGRIHQLPASVAGGVVPEPREAIDESVAVGVDELRPLAADPDLSAGMRGRAVQGVNEMFLIAEDESCVCVIGHVGSSLRDRRAPVGRGTGRTPGPGRGHAAEPVPHYEPPRPRGGGRFVRELDSMRPGFLERPGNSRMGRVGKAVS